MIQGVQVNEALKSMGFCKKTYQKEYQRKRAARKYADFKLRRTMLFEKLGGKCSICSKKAVKGFNLHHVYYHPIESDYPTHSKSFSIRLKRLYEAEEYPERFQLLCPPCHGKSHT